MIVQHGSEADGASVLRDAEELARLGAVAIAIDAPWARRPAGDITLTEQDRADQIQLIVDLRRAVDLLRSRDDVDPERIGYVGYSYGGSMGGLLAGVEDRIAAFVLSVGGGGLVSYMAYTPHTHVREGPWPAEERRRWREAMEPIEPIAWIGRAKAPIFFQFGRHDDQIIAADTNAFQRAAQVPKQVTWYDAGHVLPSEAACDAARWLEKHIGIAGNEHSACR